MQAVTIQRRTESLPTLSRSGKRVNSLHRLMRSPYLFERAYEKVSRNKGALTPGVDGKTFDGMSLETQPGRIQGAGAKYLSARRCQQAAICHGMRRSRFRSSKRVLSTAGG